jgi:hypothetical protein
MAYDTNKQKNKIGNEIDTQLDILYNSLFKLESDINNLQNGDGTSSYWNGPNAYDNLSSLIKLVNSNKKFYNDLVYCQQNSKN